MQEVNRAFVVLVQALKNELEKANEENEVGADGYFPWTEKLAVLPFVISQLEHLAKLVERLN